MMRAELLEVFLRNRAHPDCAPPPPRPHWRFALYVWGPPLTMIAALAAIAAAVMAGG